MSHRERLEALQVWHDVENTPDEDQDDVGWNDYRSLLDDFASAIETIEEQRAEIQGLRNELAAAGKPKANIMTGWPEDGEPMSDG